MVACGNRPGIHRGLNPKIHSRPEVNSYADYSSVRSHRCSLHRLHRPAAAGHDSAHHLRQVGEAGGGGEAGVPERPPRAHRLGPTPGGMYDPGALQLRQHEQRSSVHAPGS